jgi:GH24 family phage-related lysozyme (muramidase)
MGFNETAEALKKFSVEEFLFDTLQGVFKFIRRAFEDPVGLGKDIIGGIVGSIKSLFNSVIKSIAAGFGIELKTEEEKLQESMRETNAVLAKRAARLNTLLKFNQRENAALSDLEYQLASGQITENEYNQSINRGVIKGNAEVGYNASQRANQLKIAREEYRMAQQAASAAQLQLQQINNNSTVSTATQPILMTPGGTINSDDMIVTGAR